MVIRRLQAKDKNHIFALLETINEFDQAKYSLSEEWFDYVLQLHDHGLFVVELDQNENWIIALGTCMVDTTTHAADIMILVRPEYRDQNVEQVVLDKIECFADAHAIETLCIIIKKQNQWFREWLRGQGYREAYYAWNMERNLQPIYLELTCYGNGLSDSHRLIKIHQEDYSVYHGILELCFGHQIDEEQFLQNFIDSSIDMRFLQDSRTEEIVGMIAISYRTQVKSAYVYDIAVLDQYRRQGLGSQMLSEVICELISSGYERLELTVEGSNERALSLYTKLGFQVKDEDIILEKRLREYGT